MPLTELIMLLPCQGLDDFPTQRTGSDAEGLLATWTACFHPHLLATLGRMPQWTSVDEPPSPAAGQWFVVPSASRSRLAVEFSSQATTAGGGVILAADDRRQATTQLLAAAGAPAESLANPWLPDFWALGFCYLEIELLTRQMRYSSTLDQSEFQRRIIQAARAAINGDQQTADERLAACFDLLTQQRDHYYPVEVYLLDLSLVESANLDESLTERWAETVPQNVVLAGNTLEVIANEYPQLLQTLRCAVADRRIGLLTSGARDVPWPWIPSECLLENLQLGIQQFERHLEAPPHGYGGRQAILSPAIPRILADLQVKSAWHMALNGSRFPTSHQSKTTWEGWGGASVAAVARPPVDARCNAPFLKLATDLGESMDMDYVAMRCWVHWPAQAAESFTDLRRIARYGSALGRFTTWTGLIEESPDTGHWDRFSLDEYHTACLSTISRDPLSGSVRFWQHWARLWQRRNLGAMLWLLGDPIEFPAWPYAQLLDPDGHRNPPLSTETLAPTNDPARSEVMRRLAQRLGFPPADAAGGAAGYLVINPAPAPYRMSHSLPVSVVRGDHDALYAAGPAARQATSPVSIENAATPSLSDRPPHDIVVDVPMMGFVALATEASTAARADAPAAGDGPKIVQDDRLTNEFFEARVDGQTGGLLALRAYRDRTNRLSQQLAIRRPLSEGRGATYSTMVCDRMDVIESSSVVGRVRTQGRLLDQEGQTLSTFDQHYTLWRGSRVLQIDIACDLHMELAADRWENYLACRFAWADEAAIVHRSAHLAGAPSEARQLEAPLFLEIDQSDARTAIFPGGLPYHRRVGFRRLDTLLIVDGESQRRFRLGIGVDTKSALHQAVLQLAPPIVVPIASQHWQQDRGWLFHIDAPHVLVSDWQRVVDAQGVSGLRLHLQETTGQSTNGTIRTARPLARAQQVNLNGQMPRRLSVDGDHCRFEISPYDLIAIELYLTN